MNAISTLIAELSLRTTWQHDVLHVIYTRLQPGLLSVRVRDSVYTHLECLPSSAQGA